MGTPQAPPAEAATEAPTEEKQALATEAADVEPESQQEPSPEEAAGLAAIVSHTEDKLREQQSSIDTANDRKNRELRATHAEDKRQAIQDTQATGVVSAVATASTSLLDKLEDGGMTPEQAQTAFSRILRDNGQWATAFNGATTRVSTANGVNQGLKQATELLYEGLSKEMVEELGDEASELNVQVSEGAITMDVGFKKLAAKRETIARTDERAKVEKEVADRLKAEQGAAKHTEQGTPVDTTGRGSAGGSDKRSENDILMDPTTPIDKLIEIRARQKAGAR